MIGQYGFHIPFVVAFALFALVLLIANRKGRSS
jgi:hypothetical protein